MSPDLDFFSFFWRQEKVRERERELQKRAEKNPSDGGERSTGKEGRTKAFSEGIERVAARGEGGKERERERGKMLSLSAWRVELSWVVERRGICFVGDGTRVFVSPVGSA